MPTVAIVGRPNVGKSRLFNRLVRRRVSIVHDQPGVTRDVVAAEVREGYTLLDTGGLGLKDDATPREIVRATELQVDFAIAAADLVLFVVDGREGLTPLDQAIADRLRRSGRPVRLLANKIDAHESVEVPAELYALGFGEPHAVSAEHGLGELELRESIGRQLGLGPVGATVAEAAELVAEAAAEAEGLPPPGEEEGEGEPVDEAGAEGVPAPRRARAPSRPLRLAIVGRPNVGKSSLGNALFASDRLIVSDTPGTTRDAVRLECRYAFEDGTEWPFTLIDTAGIRHGTKVNSPVEVFSRLRSLEAIAEADALILVLDAMDGVTKQDKAIAGEVLGRHRPLVVAVNKWDLVMQQFSRGEVAGYTGESEYRKAFAAACAEQLFFTPGSPVIFVSALKRHAIPRLLNAVRGVESRLDRRLSTGRLNDCLIRLTEQTPPPAIRGTRFRVYYAVQTGWRPYRIRLFCNQERRLTDSYRRFLESGIVEHFHLEGCPVVFDLEGKKDRDETGEESS